MRTTQLMRIAAQAEVLLIKRQVKTTQRRVIYGVIAGVFALALLSSLHVLGWMALVQFAHIGPFFAVLIVFGVDVAVTLVFGLLASGSVTDPVAEEAREIRDHSLAQAKDSLSTAAVLYPVGRLLGRKHVYGLALAALTARYLGSGSSAPRE